jgi:hypothetical protein
VPGPGSIAHAISAGSNLVVDATATIDTLKYASCARIRFVARLTARVTQPDAVDADRERRHQLHDVDATEHDRPLDCLDHPWRGNSRFYGF